LSTSTAQQRVICLPARAERDQLAAAMLTHLLTLQGCDVVTAPDTLAANELVTLVEKSDVDIACISVVAPSTVIHARYLCLKLRSKIPDLKIIVGLWGATAGVSDVVRRLRDSGADQVVVSVADAIAQMAVAAPLPAAAARPGFVDDEENRRLKALKKLDLLDSQAEPAFDHIIAAVARHFDVPVALFSLVDSHRVFFKSHFGLRDDLSGLRQAPRDVAVCSHVVAQNAPLVVEDLRLDSRFQTNVWLDTHDLRFYAGVPLYAPGGRPIGALSVFDTRARQFSARELHELLEYAGEINDELVLRSQRETAPLTTHAAVPEAAQ
jgi:GAF domain-containing protein